jgi:hypothetical protein
MAEVITALLVPLEEIGLEEREFVVAEIGRVCGICLELVNGGIDRTDPVAGVFGGLSFRLLGFGDRLVDHERDMWLSVAAGRLIRDHLVAGSLARLWRAGHARRAGSRHVVLRNDRLIVGICTLVASM